MPAYNYKVRDKFGKPVQGIMGGESKDAVVAKLKEIGYTPVTVEEVKEEIGLRAFLNKVGFAELSMFNRQFATLQKAGIPLLSSLNALREQMRDKTLKDIIAQVTRDIEGGSSLSSALARHPRVFNAIYVNMIKSAEASGTLDEALERLATLGEHEEKVRLRIKTATRYPLMVVITIIIAFFILITLVVPRFAILYQQFTQALPLPTQILLGISYVVEKFWWLIFLILFFLIFGFNKFINTREGRLYWDSLKLKVPIFGPLLLKLIMSRFTRLIGVLLRSGVPILEVLELTQEAVGNMVISRTLNRIKTSVAEGKGLVGPMKESAIFPPVVTQMVAVGEESGKLDELLLHVSDYYDWQIDYTVNNLITMIEPLLTFILGGMVLFMALGIFLPWWNIMRLFR